MMGRYGLAIAVLGCAALAGVAGAQDRRPAAAGASDAAEIDLVYAAFRRACIAPARARRDFTQAIGAIPGWHRIPAPPSLPNSANDPQMPTWHVPGDGVDIYVHLDAAAAGDCAVSAWRVDGLAVRRAFYARLPRERLRFEAARALIPGVELRGYRGRGWNVVGSIITNTNPDPARPVLFVGLQPIR